MNNEYPADPIPEPPLPPYDPPDPAPEAVAWGRATRAASQGMSPPQDRTHRILRAANQSRHRGGTEET